MGTINPLLLKNKLLELIGSVNAVVFDGNNSIQILENYRDRAVGLLQYFGKSKDVWKEKIQSIVFYDRNGLFNGNANDEPCFESGKGKLLFILDSLVNEVDLLE